MLLIGTEIPGSGNSKCLVSGDLGCTHSSFVRTEFGLCRTGPHKVPRGRFPWRVTDLARDVMFLGDKSRTFCACFFYSFVTFIYRCIG
ncbi:hypothetical protein B0F90DRAFT_1912020, partial [Multifurca ochricompacta]